jgi:hypothetical protein
VYGSRSLAVVFANGGLTGTGTVTFYDGKGSSPVMVGTAPLSSNTATLSTARLSAGTHYLIAAYGGDAHNASITSGVYIYIVTPAPLTAVASGVAISFGQAVPTLTGTLTGVLAQDTSNVTAMFTSTAAITSPPGAYPIAVNLAGTAAGNYEVSLGPGSGSVTISKAASLIELTSSSASPIFGVPFTLTAKATSTTSGTPTGGVNFYDGATLLNQTPVALSNGVATFSSSSLPVGSATLTAVYSGDTDFLTSTSSILPVTLLSPDFTIAATPPSQNILPSQSVNYSVAVTPTNATFLYPVSLSVSGLPDGVTASFNPSSVAAGSTATSTTLTLSASAAAAIPGKSMPGTGAGGLSALGLVWRPFAVRKGTRRTARRLSRALVVLGALGAIGLLSGCGAGGFFSHATGGYTVKVTAVSGPNTHNTNVTLTLQ